MLCYTSAESKYWEPATGRLGAGRREKEWIVQLESGITEVHIRCRIENINEFRL